MSYLVLASQLAKFGVEHKVVTSGSASAKPKVGDKLMFDYIYAEPGENPFTSELIKTKKGYQFTSGVPSKTQQHNVLNLSPVYPLRNNYVYPSLQHVVDKIDEANKRNDVSVTNYRWVKTKDEDTVVAKPITKNGEKQFTVFVEGLGWFQSYGLGRDDFHYARRIDIENGLDVVRALTKADLKKAVFGYKMSRTNMNATTERQLVALLEQ